MLKERIDGLLDRVQKPARYMGGEMNAVLKDPDSVDIRYAFAFPDVYEVGMSHLGSRILYDIINKRDDALCERVFMPWVDMADLMREEKVPLFSIETRSAVREFDMQGITLQYEMSYTNILEMLDLAGIPLHSEDRPGRIRSSSRVARALSTRNRCIILLMRSPSATVKSARWKRSML